MKAPDVIYVEFSEEVNLAFEKQPFGETPAYIRKEALLEWIEKEIQALSDGSLSGYYISLAYKDMIEHLNKM